MKHKNIHGRAATLLQALYRQEVPCFTIQNAQAIHPDLSKNTLEKLLSNMTQQGLLMRVKRGLYYTIPYEQEAATFMPQWHLLAPCLAQGREYYIAYHSALHLHGMGTQPALREQIVVDKPPNLTTIYIKEIPFQFIYHNGQHFFGQQQTWINSFVQVYCSDAEKTIIDSLFIPAYAGGIVEVAQALQRSWCKLNPLKLLAYCKRFRSQAVIKRLGFLLELLKIKTVLVQDLQKLKTRSYVPLDPEMPDEGPRSSRWSIQQNLESSTILSALLT